MLFGAYDKSQRKSLGLLVPRLLDDINVPSLVKNTPKIISCEAGGIQDAAAVETLTLTLSGNNKQ